MSNEEVELFNLFSERLNVKDENGKPKKMDESELEDIIEKTFDSYSCQTSGSQGAGAVISNVMTRVTGIRFPITELIQIVTLIQLSFSKKITHGTTTKRKKV